MIDLIVSFCLLASPDQCSHITMNLPEETRTTQQCFMGSQLAIIEYLKDHPQINNVAITEYKIGKITCKDRAVALNKSDMF